MKQRLRIELDENFKLKDLLKPWAFKPVFVVFLMMFLYQFSGINPAVFNAVAIFDASGWTLDPLVSNIILSADQVNSKKSSSTIIYTFKKGNRLLKVYSSIFLLLLGGTFGPPTSIYFIHDDNGIVHVCFGNFLLHSRVLRRSYNR